jgi:carboxyl-terminal processing protease
MTFRNSKFKLTVTGFIIVVIFASGVLVAKLMAQRVTNLRQSLERFAYVLNIVSNDYVEPVDIDKLMKAAINGMLDALDPNTNYLETDEYNDLK